PFEDVRVVDFSQRLPGPYCSSILADLGADVIMVERAGSPPETRSVFPGLFELVNRNKKSITLNLKSNEGKGIAERIIKNSDVLLEEARPGVADRLGIGYDHVKGMNPSIIYCSISGFGQDGPYRDRAGHDINYLSLSGILSIPGQPDTPPTRPGVPLVDLASGMFAAIAVMAALRRRDAEGVGERIDISMFDSMISWMGVRAGSLLVYGDKPGNEHLSALNNIYETKDGKKISLGILEEHFWRSFCEAAGRQDLAEDPRFCSPALRKTHTRELLPEVRSIISERTREDWDRVLDWRKVPYAPVHSLEEAIADCHVEKRGLLQEIEAGPLGKIKEVLFPPKFSGFKTQITRPPPQWGEHTEEVLKDVGCTQSEIALLRQKNII
ncbi:MAG: CaiB/BaiF CoA-transferase family protein, partial [Thermodesulfobacteriota bacterium]|nr:CaiB/BaiF CoA-transferase family protein [Thermodesulfobacteriota bacterium]